MDWMEERIVAYEPRSERIRTAGAWVFAWIIFLPFLPFFLLAGLIGVARVFLSRVLYGRWPT